MRTAKSCGSDAPGLASSLREEAQATVTTKPGHRGEREVSRKTIARGMPGDFRCDRGDYARVLFYFAREAAGACVWRHCEERSDEAIQAFLWLHGLLRGACHRAALCADPLARNDVEWLFEI